MSPIVTGLFLILLGSANVYGSRRRPDVDSAPFLKKVGWVGIGCGLIVVIYGVVGLFRPVG